MSHLSYIGLMQFSFTLLVAAFVCVTVLTAICSLRMRKFYIPCPGIVGVVILSSLLFMGVCVALMDHAETEIRINEVAKNKERFLFAGEAYAMDYIELYNTGELTNMMSGYYLSDDMGNLKKLNLSGYAIEPKGWYVFPLAGVPFAIDRGGASIYLSNEQGEVLDFVTCPPFSEENAYARVEDGTGEWEKMSKSPGEANGSVREASLKKPVFSRDSGLYEEPFALQMDAEEGEVIYYTTDGSTPDTQSKRYEAPISVYDRSAEPDVYRGIKNVVTDWMTYEPDTEPKEKAFIVRAIAVNGKGERSDPATAVFWIGKKGYEKKNLLSLVADPEDLFGDYGIYVTGKKYDAWYLNGGGGEPTPNFLQTGRAWEIPVDIALFHGEKVMQQRAGLRIQGSSAREESKKRFSIYARTSYDGDDYFDAELFGEGKTHAVMLKDNFFDACVPLLVGERDIAVQRSLPVTVFLNGEYWYDTYMLEKFSEKYFQERYGIPEEDVVLLKGDEGQAQSLFFDPLQSWLDTHDPAESDDYEELSEIIDIQSYIDFMCVNIYIANMDFSETWNVYHWKSRTGTGEGAADGRWRWALYDIDYAGYVADDSDADGAAINTFREQMPYVTSVPLDERPLWQALIRNKDFCEQFVSSFMEIADECFSEDRLAVLAARDDLPGAADGVAFLQRRRAYALRYLAEEFGLSEEQ